MAQHHHSKTGEPLPMPEAELEALAAHYDRTDMSAALASPDAMLYTTDAAGRPVTVPFNS